MYTYIHVCIHTYTYIQIHVYVLVYTCVYTYTYIHIYIYTYIRIYIYTYIHIYIYTYIHIYIYTYIQSYIRACKKYACTRYTYMVHILDCSFFLGCFNTRLALERFQPEQLMMGKMYEMRPIYYEGRHETCEEPKGVLANLLARLRAILHRHQHQRTI